MPDYVWVCHRCKRANIPGTESCESCGFPAVATGADIDRATGNARAPLLQGRKEYLKARRDELAALALWKKPLAYFRRAVQFVGAIVFWGGVVNLSVLLILLAILMVLVAELFFQVLKGKPYAWEAI